MTQTNPPTNPGGRTDDWQHADQKVVTFPQRGSYYVGDPPPAAPAPSAARLRTTTVDITVREGFEFYLSEKESGGHPATLTHDLVRCCERTLNMLRARLGLRPVDLVVVDADHTDVDPADVVDPADDPDGQIG